MPKQGWMSDVGALWPHWRANLTLANGTSEKDTLVSPDALSHLVEVRHYVAISDAGRRAVDVRVGPCHGDESRRWGVICAIVIHGELITAMTRSPDDNEVDRDRRGCRESHWGRDDSIADAGRDVVMTVRLEDDS